MPPKRGSVAGPVPGVLTLTMGLIAGPYEVAANVPCTLGEGPLWHPEEQRLYWTDIEGRRIYRLDPVSGQHEVALEPGMRVGGITLEPDGSLILFGDHGQIAHAKDGGLRTLVDGLPDEHGTRFNDVFAEVTGQVYAGTMPKEGRLGRFYRIDRTLQPHLLLEEIGCSNGMGFTPTRRHLYYIDTGVRKIYRFDYDEATGLVSNQITFLETPESMGWPDGMTTDAEGNLWVAFWGGYGVRAFSPSGEELAYLELPVECVTAPTILPDGRMFVTTAGGDKRKGPDDLAGSVFVVQLNVAGVLEQRSRLSGGQA